MVVYLTPTTARLPDLCARALGYVSWLCEGAEVAEDQARFKFEEIFRELDRLGQQAGYDITHVRLVIFALVVYADERILTSQWEGKAGWLENPLQLELFNLNSGGEEFFLRLEQLRRDGGDQQRLADVLECFLMCLQLGFAGRYGSSQAARKQLEETVGQLSADIAQRRGAPADLVVDAKSPAAVPADRRPTIPAWLVPVCALGAVVVTLIVLNVFLTTRIGALADSVAGVAP
ncbi:MAG: DotU family type IV/VI secretion system protein [Planctomycetota bacterium]|jgi:type VI secretion system protein ImpK|nr:DotU family type IV/VI secretion system protein [Planctomycetota bacterium]